MCRQVSSASSAAISTAGCWRVFARLSRWRGSDPMAGGIRENSGEELDVNHEINVTPFIDVMLVLLIIFMVAAPLATVDVNVDLPVSNATPAPRPQEPLFVTLKDDLTLAIGNDALNRETIASALDQVTGGDRETRVFLRADATVAYGELMEV